MQDGMEMTPNPGSRIGRAASAAAQAMPEAAAVELHQTDLASVQPDMRPVPVQSVAAEESVPRTLVLQPNQARQLMPQDPARQSAVILAVDADIVICDTKDLASSPDNQLASLPYPTGFYLPKGVPLPTRNRGLLWAVNTSSTVANRVSVLAEINANPDPLSHG